MRKSKTGNIAVLLVFCALAMCLLLTLLMGVRVYRSLTSRGEDTYARRTVRQYVSNRVRQADGGDAVSVEDFEGVCALTIRQTIDGAGYLTRIYCHEGFLYELFAAEGSSLHPRDGEQLMPTGELSFALEDRLLTVQAEDRTFMLYLRSGEVQP